MLKAKEFTGHPSLCKFVNEEKVRVVSITHCGACYTLFYEEASNPEKYIEKCSTTERLREQFANYKETNQVIDALNEITSDTEEQEEILDDIMFHPQYFDLPIDQLDRMIAKATMLATQQWQYMWKLKKAGI